MIRDRVTLTSKTLSSRANAVALVQLASRYESRIMLEHAHKIVNAKSTLGLLSLCADADAVTMLVVEGPDEAEANSAVRALLQTLGE